MVNFSAKQMEVLTWWNPGSREAGRDAIICHGAVRSGKTLALSLSFVAWAMKTFEGTSFALCAKTQVAAERNLVEPLLPLLEGLGFQCRWRQSKGVVDITHQGRRNRFWLFGGRDEGSRGLIQGITLGGALLDEVVLMPRSFVEQAAARCSREGAKLWFSCNPEHPGHWFYQEWIEKAEEKNALVLHFVMADNPSLSPTTLARYQSLYSGSFYQRFVLGEWVAQTGVVYPMFQKEALVQEAPEGLGRWHISCDYGTVNPCSMGLWGEKSGIWYRVAEYYHDSRGAGTQHTDEEYYQALEALAGGRTLEGVVVDPSAASFLECIRRHGKHPAIAGENRVADGIRQVSEAIRSGKIRIGACCKDSIREFGQYRWAPGREKDLPYKDHDHAMDDIRYFVATVVNREDCGFWVGVPRRGL